ncbi:hypothetical protein [Pseudomonas lurida]|uniref:hypothetical protein n=1 Tax=Pseudomonas lurida TaxID=244566 RepID=UPI0016479293|nr:hypothetical protein [Pseudomonas lurida]MBC3233974.1 hypothetical protein [Pseudomonas lurida]
MFDKNGREIKVGDICFYSERPHSNYADSLVEVYERDGRVLVGTHVVNAVGGHYIQHGRNPGDDLELSTYGWDVCNKPTEQAEGLAVIDGLTADQATVEYANQHFPLN